VFTRRADPGRDQRWKKSSRRPKSGGSFRRGAPDLMPIWTVLDMTPDGRKPGWYPRLEY